MPGYFGYLYRSNFYGHVTDARFLSGLTPDLSNTLHSICNRVSPLQESAAFNLYAIFYDLTGNFTPIFVAKTDPDTSTYCTVLIVTPLL